MYVETTREKGSHDATTLEEAAEELLNGLLCHYEPPDPRNKKKFQKEWNKIYDRNKNYIILSADDHRALLHARQHL